MATAASRRGSTKLPSLKQLSHATKVGEKLKQKAADAKRRVEERARRAEFTLVSDTPSRMHVWVRDKAKAFIPGTIVDDLGDSVKVEVGPTRELRTVSRGDLGPPITRLEDLQNHVDDMVKVRASAPPDAWCCFPAKLHLSACRWET
jgi:hypothetical protein